MSAVHHFVDGTIPAHGNDPVIAFLARLFCQFNGVTGIDRAAPGHVAVLFRDGSQIACDAPGISHICHGVQDDFDFRCMRFMTMTLSS